MNEELIDQAILGDEAKQFIESALGKKILDMAVEEAIAAQEQLAEVDPEDSKKIRELQNKVHWAKEFEGWLLHLVSAGENALSAFKQQEES